MQLPLDCLCMCSGCMKAGRRQEDWSQLPSHLWATVFVCLTCTDIPILCTISSGQLPCTAYSWQSCLFRLRLVCQTFNQVFEQSARLNSHVYVSKLVQSCSLPRLVEWLRRHRNHVKRLDVQHGSVELESLLVALQSPDTCLEKVDVAASLPSSIVMLSTFQSITECSLHSESSWTCKLCQLCHSSPDLLCSVGISCVLMRQLI